jgi:hypothetical protein
MFDSTWVCGFCYYVTIVLGMVKRCSKEPALCYNTRHHNPKLLLSCKLKMSAFSCSHNTVLIDVKLVSPEYFLTIITWKLMRKQGRS